MKARYILIAALLTLVASACTKVIEFPINETTPYVVVMSKPNTEDNIVLRLSYSRFFLDQHDFTTINNASILVDVNGTPYSGTFNPNGEYSLNYTPQPGDKLKLSIHVPGYDEVTASTQVPLLPTIDEVKYQTSPDGNGTLHVRFTDRADQNDYYRLRVHCIDTVIWVNVDYDYRTGTRDTIGYDTIIRNFYQNFECNDYVLIDQTSIQTAMDEGTFDGTSLYFTDEAISGRSHDVQLKYYSYDVPEDYYYNEIHHCHYYVELESMSRDLYLYELTASSDDDILSTLSDPVQIHCNIDGGIGIFAASAKVVREVPKPITEK